MWYFSFQSWFCWRRAGGWRSLSSRPEKSQGQVRVSASQPPASLILLELEPEGGEGGRGGERGRGREGGGEGGRGGGRVRGREGGRERERDLHKAS